MFQVLANTRFATLFAAQVVALLGTGLLTIALALLAYDLAGNASTAPDPFSFYFCKAIEDNGISGAQSLLTGQKPDTLFGLAATGPDTIRVVKSLSCMCRDTICEAQNQTPQLPIHSYHHKNRLNPCSEARFP